MKDIATAAYELLKKGESFALAAIVTQTGSTPRTAGAKMLIKSDGSFVGTIGGGLVEANAIRTAKEVIEKKSPYLMYYNLNNKDAGKHGMTCGGETEVFIDYVNAEISEYVEIYKELSALLQKGRSAWLGFFVPKEKGLDLTRIKCRQCLLMPDNRLISEVKLEDDVLKKSKIDGYDITVLSEERLLYLQRVSTEDKVIIFGAGHVSQKLASILSMVGFQTVVMDDREEFANKKRFPMTDKVIVLPDFNNVFKDIDCDENTFCVIVTRGHAFDKIVLGQVLKTPARYVGMIGSIGKRDAIYDALKEEGFTDKDIERVYSPIGISIGAETPEEISVSIAAEMIQVRRGGK